MGKRLQEYYDETLLAIHHQVVHQRTCEAEKCVTCAELKAKADHHRRLYAQECERTFNPEITEKGHGA